MIDLNTMKKEDIIKSYNTFIKYGLMEDGGNFKLALLGFTRDRFKLLALNARLMRPSECCYDYNTSVKISEEELEYLYKEALKILDMYNVGKGNFKVMFDIACGYVIENKDFDFTLKPKTKEDEIKAMENFAYGNMVLIGLLVSMFKRYEKEFADFEVVYDFKSDGEVNTVFDILKKQIERHEFTDIIFSKNVLSGYVSDFIKDDKRIVDYTNIDKMSVVDVNLIFMFSQYFFTLVENYEDIGSEKRLKCADVFNMLYRFFDFKNKGKLNLYLSSFVMSANINSLVNGDFLKNAEKYDKIYTSLFIFSVSLILLSKKGIGIYKPFADECFIETVFEYLEKNNSMSCLMEVINKLIDDCSYDLSKVEKILDIK